MLRGIELGTGNTAATTLKHSAGRVSTGLAIITSALVALTIGGFDLAQAHTSSRAAPPGSTSASPAPADRFSSDARLRRGPRHTRPGCGSACRNLGGLGGGSGPIPPSRIAVLAKTVRIKDGVVAIPMRCLIRMPCAGVLLAAAAPGSAPNAPELSRVDLQIPARTELVIEVTLSKQGLAYVRAHHRVHVGLTAVYPGKRGGIDELTITFVG